MTAIKVGKNTTTNINIKIITIIQHNLFLNYGPHN